MPVVEITEHSVQVRLSLVEKVAGVLRDQSVPLNSVRAVQVVPDGLAQVRGIRAPGLHLPGVNKYGTWRGRGKTWVAVTRRRPALVLHVDDHPYERIIVSTDDAASLADRLGRLQGRMPGGSAEPGTRPQDS